MIEENDIVSEEEDLEENSDATQEVAEDVTEEVEDNQNAEDSEEEPEVSAAVESDTESGQVDSDEGDPDWMVKRLKRQRKKINDEHVQSTQQMRYELEQLRQQVNPTAVPPGQNATAPGEALSGPVTWEQLHAQEEAELQGQNDKQNHYIHGQRLKFGQELQDKAAASESGDDPCIGRLNESMMDNAMRFSNGADVLRTICSGPEWQRIVSLQPIEQAREMEKYSRKLARMTANKTKSGAPPPKGRNTTPSAPALSKSSNEMTAQDYKVAIREGRL